MAAKAPVYIANRFFASTGVASPLANDNTSVTGYDKANEFIVVFQVDETTGPWNAAYTLRWRNVTDAGSFAAIASTGEMAWGTGTALTNGTAITSKWCQGTGGPGSTWQNGEEVEGAATSDAINLVDEYYTEIAFAVNPASALGGKEYAYELYDQTNGAAISAGTGTLTVATSGTDYEPVLEGMDGWFNYGGVSTQFLDYKPAVEGMDGFFVQGGVSTLYLGVHDTDGMADHRFSVASEISADVSNNFEPVLEGKEGFATAYAPTLFVSWVQDGLGIADFSVASDISSVITTAYQHVGDVATYFAVAHEPAIGRVPDVGAACDFSSVADISSTTATAHQHTADIAASFVAGATLFAAWVLDGIGVAQFSAAGSASVDLFGEDYEYEGTAAWSGTGGAHLFLGIDNESDVPVALSVQPGMELWLSIYKEPSAIPMHRWAAAADVTSSGSVTDYFHTGAVEAQFAADAEKACTRNFVSDAAVSFAASHEIGTAEGYDYEGAAAASFAASHVYSFGKVHDAQEPAFGPVAAASVIIDALRVSSIAYEHEGAVGWVGAVAADAERVYQRIWEGTPYGVFSATHDYSFGVVREGTAYVVFGVGGAIVADLYGPILPDIEDVPSTVRTAEAIPSAGPSQDGAWTEVGQDGAWTENVGFAMAHPVQGAYTEDDSYILEIKPNVFTTTEATGANTFTTEGKPSGTHIPEQVP